MLLVFAIRLRLVVVAAVAAVAGAGAGSGGWGGWSWAVVGGSDWWWVVVGVGWWVVVITLHYRMHGAVFRRVTVQITSYIQNAGLCPSKRYSLPVSSCQRTRS